MEYRMYCLSERHLSGIQKTIQAAHAIVEYSLAYGDSPKYKQWAGEDKTIIVLDGGIYTDMLRVVDFLNEKHMNFATFKEPDMGYMMTSIALLVDERVWDASKYGRSYAHYQLMCQEDCELPKLYYNEWVDWIGGKSNELLKTLLFSLKLTI